MPKIFNFSQHSALVFLLSCQIVFAPLFAYGESAAPVMPTTQTRIDDIYETVTNPPNEAFVPAANFEVSIPDPVTGQVKTMTITYAVSHNKAEYDSLSAYMQNELKQDQAQGDETGLLLGSTEGDSADMIPKVDPKDWGVEPQNVTAFKIVTNKLEQFKDWMDHTLDKIEERYQRAQTNSALDKIDRQNERVLRRHLREARRTQSFYGKMLKSLQKPIRKTGRFSKTSPWKLGAYRNRPTYRYEATFAIFRTLAVTGAVAAGFIYNRDLALPMLGTILSSFAMGLGSGFIMINGDLYLDWFKRSGIFSNKILRPAFRTVARPIALILGKSKEDVARWDERFSKSVFHRLSNEMGKYLITEIPFVAIPGFVFWLTCGVFIYPDAVHWHTVHSSLPWLNSICAFVLPAVYVAKKLATSIWQGYESQGTSDTGNSNILSGKIHEVQERLKNGDISGEAAAVKIADMRFKSQVAVFGVSLLSNLGVALGIPDSVAAKALGKKIIGGLAIAGTTAWTYSTIHYDQYFRGFIFQNKQRLEALLYKLFVKPQEGSCAALLSMNRII